MSENKLKDLEDCIFDSWAKTLIENSRVSKGSLKDLTPSQKLQRAIKPLLNDIERLRTSYQVEREEVDGRLMQHAKSANAYLAGFHLANSSRMQSLLRRAEAENPNFISNGLGSSPSIYDFGCGTGTLSSTLSTFLHLQAQDPSRFTPKVFHYDSNRHLLDLASKLQRNLPLHNPYDRQIRTTMDQIDPTRALARENDSSSVYLLGYVWNEICNHKRSRNKLMQIFEKAASHDKPAMILILEPATQQTWQGIVSLKNALHEMGLLTMYPCPHFSHCPLQGKDRCYSEFSLEPSERYQKIDSLQKMFRTKIATSSYIFVNKKMVAETPGKMKSYDRMVGFPTPKGQAHSKSSTIVCTKDGNTTKLNKEAKNSLRCQAVRD